jgi:hypothetical protein
MGRATNAHADERGNTLAAAIGTEIEQKLRSGVET